eukprot:CAMPEP_0180141800 /NCGR_PEP_ID=MMETSP0986-20121125/15158_1 /TAXON_ID=697907 /ORGANISM="non described non described, Strain CCMP2293" /LENGTH=53 /DNA_ID=CAMNT_0022084791 /DNA_START=42 /DNA_END=203 /DNA_ORIENTATION=+
MLEIPPATTTTTPVLRNQPLEGASGTTASRTPSTTTPALGNPRTQGLPSKPSS